MRLSLVKWLIVFFSLISFPCISQEYDDLPKIFLDCQTNCFSEFVRQELTYVNYMRERQNADVYVLITDQRASAGAEQIQLIFAYDDYPNLSPDTIQYINEANISNDEERRRFLSYLKKGLLPALMNSPLNEFISFDISLPDNGLDVNKTEIKDPWNYWSFNTSVNINVSGESSFTEQNYFTRVTASRVTADQKVFAMLRYNLNQSEFTLSDSSVVNSRNERFRAFTQYVWSINDHWSLGYRALAGSSTFSNIDFDLQFKPAVEYNIYPYSENQTRRFTLMYSVGYVYQNYTELTVFNKLDESLGQHGLDIEYQMTQKWGDINFDIEFDQYLHNLELYSVSFNPNIELNIVKGLRLNFGGFIELVSDRINITNGDISDQDIILQNRQLDTNYSYWTYFGFNYRFGSANNNIINPRF